MTTLPIVFALTLQIAAAVTGLVWWQRQEAQRTNLWETQYQAEYAYQYCQRKKALYTNLERARIWLQKRHLPRRHYTATLSSLCASPQTWNAYQLHLTPQTVLSKFWPNMGLRYGS